MKNYKEETTEMISQLMKKFVIKELDITWTPQRVTNVGENKCDTKETMINILVPTVKIKLY